MRDGVMHLSMLRLCTGISGDRWGFDTECVKFPTPQLLSNVKSPPMSCEGIIVIIIITKITSDDHTRAYAQVLELTHAQVKSPTPGA